MAIMKRQASKSALVKELHDKGIPVPDEPTIKNLTERLSWLPGKGYVFRRFKVHPDPLHPCMRLEQNVLTYVPNSPMAEKIVKSRKVMMIARTLMPWDGIPILDPTEEEE